MTLKEKQLEFIIYCIENTAERLGRYSADVYNKLKELGAIDGYINAFYDTLHTQGKAYIVDSLLEYIYHRDPQWLPKDYRPFQISHVNCLSWFYLPCRTTYLLLLAVLYSFLNSRYKLRIAGTCCSSEIYNLPFSINQQIIGHSIYFPLFANFL